MFSGLAFSATYNLPDGPLPSGCNKVSSTSVTCAGLSLAWADAIVVSQANLTLTISNTLQVAGNNINTSSPASGFAIQANVFVGGSNVNLNGNINAVNKVTIGNASTITGDITSTKDEVLMLSANSNVVGNITAKSTVTLGSSCTVTGDISTEDEVLLQSSSSKVTGNIIAQKKVTLESSTSVTGSVKSLIGDIELNSSSASVSQCVTVDKNQSIILGWHATVGGVCCLSGSSCSGTSCVNNNSGYAMPGVCSAALSCVVDNFSTGTLNSALWNTATVGTAPYTPTVVDVGGSKRLRLTQAVGYQSTMTQLKKWYPGASNKIVVEFDYYAYGGNGADGVTVVFSDAGQSPSAGGFGGSLGYAQRSGGINGFVGGWLGVGLDEFGNFPTITEGRTGYPTGYTAPSGANSPVGRYTNNISVRGSGSASTGYPLLANTGSLTTPIWQSSNTSSTKQRFRITIDHSDGVHAYVSVERDLTGTGSSYSTLVAPFDAKASASQAAVPANWLVSFTGSTGGSYNIHELANLSICATSVTDPAGSVNAAAFDCLETGQNTSWSASARRPLFTKLAGTPFGFDIVALKTDGTLESTYVVSGGDTRYVKVDLYDDATAPACTAVTPVGSSAVVAFKSGTMVTGGRANKTAADVTMSLTVPAAYKKLRCRVRECTDATCTGFSAQAAACSSDPFSVRPGLVSLVTSATAAAPSASATPTFKAGKNFTLQATTSTKSTDGYAGNLVQDTSKFTAQTTSQDTSQASGGAVGVLAPSSLVANAAAVSATYSEVGYLYLGAGAYYDSTYTAVDGTTDCVSGSTSVTLSGGKYGCVIGNTAALGLGRFIPDHFAISPGNVTAACTVHPAAFTGYVPTDFSYFGQDGFSTAFMLTAQNLANGTTANYAGAFARLNLSNYPDYGFGTTIALPTGSALTSSATAPASGTWVSGVANNILVKHQVSRPTAPASENDIWVTALPVDPDGVTMPSAVKVSNSTTKLRYGRIRLKNAFGSELLPLDVPIQAQYWNGSNFVNNADDSCTTLSVPPAKTTVFDGTVGRYYSADSKNKLVAPDPVPLIKTVATIPVVTSHLVGGKSSLNFPRPSPSNAGWIDIILGVDDYLKYNWGNCNGQIGAAGLLDDFPCSRVTFGVYNSKSPIIYRRENY